MVKSTDTEKQPQATTSATNVPDPSKRSEAEGNKATEFNGNPNPEATRSGPFGPKDDTPMRLKKVEGPTGKDQRDEAQRKKE